MYQIEDCEDYQPCRIFLKEELVVTIMMDTRTTKTVEFRTKCKLNKHDPILTKEQSIGSKIAFLNEKIKEKFVFLNEIIDFYFPGHKLAIEEHLKCTFFRISPDKENFDIFLELGKIESYINESNKKLTEESTKKSLIDDLSKRLSESKFEKHNSIKSKCVKSKKILPTL